MYTYVIFTFIVWYRLLGVCGDEGKGPMCIVMEYMSGGSLHDYLITRGSYQTKKKLCMSMDASKVSSTLELEIRRLNIDV